MSTNTLLNHWKPRAVPGESPAGLLLRYTGVYVEQPTYILKHSGYAANNLPSIISSLFRGETTLLDEISDTSNWSISPLMKAAANSRQHLRWFNSKRCKVCPDCAVEGVLPASHDWRCINVCTRHKLQLQETCTGCSKPLTWSRPGIGRCTCFREIDHRVPASSAALAFTNALEECIDANDLERLTFLTNAHEKLSQRYGSAIDTQSIAVALVQGDESLLVDALGRFSNAHPTLPSMIIAMPAAPFLKSMALENIRRLLNASSEKQKKALSLPTEFRLNAQEIRLAMRCKSTTVKHLIRHANREGSCDVGKSSLTLAELTKVFDVLSPLNGNQHGASTSLKELASLSDKSIGDWLIGVLKGDFQVTAWDRSDFGSIQINTTISADSDVPDGYFTLAQARTYLGLYGVAMTSIREAKLVEVITQNNRFGRYLFEKKSLDYFLKTYATGGQLAKLWGVPATNLSEKLMALGIEPASGPDIDGAKLYIFCRSSVKRINKHTLDQISGNYARSGRKAGDPQSYDASKWMAAVDAAAHLDISVQALKHFIRPGLLIQGTPTNADSRSTRYFRVTSVRAAEKFLKNLVLIDDLSVKCGLPRTQLVRRTNQLLRNAIFQYRGKDWVSSDDAATLVSHCSRLWSTDTAAHYWNCTRHDIGNWLRLGHLKAIDHSDPEYLGSPKLFLSGDVKRLNVPGSRRMSVIND